MPLIDIQVMEGVFGDDEKARMITEVTKGFGSVAGQAMADATSVRIHEVKSGSWGYGGKPFYLHDAMAIKNRG